MAIRSDFRPAASKLEAVQRIGAITGQPETLGPGSKEHKSTLLKLAQQVGLHLDPDLTKVEIAEHLSRELDFSWDSVCWSAGHTITLEGLNRILGATEGWNAREARGSDEQSSEAKETSSMPNLAWQDSDEFAIENPRADLQFDAAEQLALLSGVSDTPNEFESGSDAFKAEDVDFTTSEWMVALSAVQGWLRFPRQLVLDDREDFWSALAEGLGFSDPSAAVEGSEDTTALTDDALSRLMERAEKAVKLQETFLEELEKESGTRASATARWAELWEDEPDDSDEAYPDQPVSAVATTWPINEFVGMAQKGRLDLSPSYQRGDVWPTKDAQMLIESILRGIPLPSIIVLSPKDQASNRSEVVDGKQRLTAILRFIGQHPRALKWVEEFDAQHPDEDLMHVYLTDYPKFRRAWKNLRGEALSAAKESEYYFPFKLRSDGRALSGDLEPLRGKYYTQIKNHRLKIADGIEELGDVFETQSDYKVPVIRYSKASHRQIHEVFNLYNKQGKHLNAEEIRNAIFHELDLTRAILAAAGDCSPDTALTTVAPFLEPVWDQVGPLQLTLEDYRFGVSRYRRTKVLSWILAMLVFDTMEDAQPRLFSTARQIDAFLQQVQDEPQHRLREVGAIREILSLIARASAAHSAIEEAWAPTFRDSKSGSKWQELQLIGSLVGVAIATTLDPDGVEDRLAQSASEMRSASLTWKRPRKTQTTQQWQYIAKIARGVVEVLGVGAGEASAVLNERFGSSGITTLWAVKGYAEVS